MHPNSLQAFCRHCAPLFTSGMRVLEIGPESIPSVHERAIAADRTCHWDTLDISDDPRLTYRSVPDAEYPIPDDAYDVVLSSQVIEHVRQPWVWMCELTRICKPGGLVITVCPVTWPHHPMPVDCWRIWPDGMRELHAWAGLRTQLAETERSWGVVDTVAIGRK